MSAIFILFIIFLTTICNQNIKCDEINSDEKLIRVVPAKMFNKHKRIRRMVNAESVNNLEDFPYEVGLELYSSSDMVFWCSGSILSTIWILTAAHCLKEIEKAVVEFGITDRIDPEPTEQLRTITAKDFIIHEDYNEQLMYNDIGLIRLRTPIQFSNVVKPIELIKLKDANKIDNKTITVSGWGVTSDWDTLADILEWSNVTILSNNKCQILIQTFDWPLCDINTTTFICADNNLNTGFCKGDSGSAAVTELNGIPTQIGINAFGVIDNRLSECEQPAARVLTRVSSHLDWICKNSGVCSI